jgi:hypothetical protein
MFNMVFSEIRSVEEFLKERNFGVLREPVSVRTSDVLGDAMRKVFFSYYVCCGFIVVCVCVCLEGGGFLNTFVGRNTSFAGRSESHTPCLGC